MVTPPESVGLRRIHQRAHEELVTRDREAPWPQVRSDAIQLSMLVKSLVGQVHAYNNGETRPGQDLCPLCASYTWGRPVLDEPVPTREGGTPDYHDYARRQCHVCDMIRPEPEEKVLTK